MLLERRQRQEQREAAAPEEGDAPLAWSYRLEEVVGIWLNRSGRPGSPAQDQERVTSADSSRCSGCKCFHHNNSRHLHSSYRQTRWSGGTSLLQWTQDQTVLCLVAFAGWA